jgi:hypothetical protein
VKGVFTAQVYTRGLIARLLGLPSEQLLIEWGITLGNDYTAQFDSIPGKSNSPESMLAYVKQQGQGYLVPDGGNAELAQALQFTRLLYEVRVAVVMIYIMKYVFRSGSSSCRNSVVLRCCLYLRWLLVLRSKLVRTVLALQCTSLMPTRSLAKCVIAEV